VIVTIVLIAVRLPRLSPHSIERVAQMFVNSFTSWVLAPATAVLG
jgi:hypothetical protein